MPKPKATTAPDGPKIKLSGTPQLVEDDTVKLPGLGDNAIFVVTGYIRKRTEDCPEDGKPETEVLMATMKQLAVVPPEAWAEIISKYGISFDIDDTGDADGPADTRDAL